MVNDHKRAWAFFKSDHEAAYKQLPYGTNHTAETVIALRSPSDARWYGFIRHAKVFGAVASVLRCDIFHRVIYELFTKLFGAAVICFR